MSSVVMSQRLTRALKERMYLISSKQIDKENWKFGVEGSSGKIYNVLFTEKYMSCSCPDHIIRKTICKHINFIIVRVLKDVELAVSIEKSDKGHNISIFEIKNSFSKDLNNILDKKNENCSDDIKHNPDEDCSICYEDYSKNEDISQCESCKKFFHKDCISVWLRKASRRTCPMCRSEWFKFTTTEINDPMIKFNNNS